MEQRSPSQWGWVPCRCEICEIPGGQFLHGTLLGPVMYMDSLGNVFDTHRQLGWARSTSTEPSLIQ